MTYLSDEQKKTISLLYKFGRKTVQFESHINFLSKSLEIGFIPKSFRLKNNLPGNSTVNGERIKNVSRDAIKDEKHKHFNNLEWSRTEFNKQKCKLDKVIVMKK